jgi:drug/metabolite transporter (DMT)-like permease
MDAAPDTRPPGAAAPPERASAGHGRPWQSTRFLAVVLCVVWAMMFIVQRLALEVAPALWVGALRVVVAAVVLLPLAKALRGVGRRGLATIGVLALTNQVGFIGLQVAGLQTVGAGPAAAIVYLQPVLVVLASGPMGGERLTRRRLTAVLLGLAGVGVIGLHQAAAASLAGVLFLLAAAVSWAAGTLITSASEEPIMRLVVGQHLLGGPMLAGIAALAEPFPPLSAQLVACVVFAGACGSALGWTILGTLLRRGDAGTVSTWLYAVPVLAAVLGVVILGESPSATLVVGIALVALGVRLVAAPLRRGVARSR